MAPQLRMSPPTPRRRAHYAANRLPPQMNAEDAHLDRGVRVRVHGSQSKGAHAEQEERKQCDRPGDNACRLYLNDATAWT